MIDVSRNANQLCALVRVTPHITLFARYCPKVIIIIITFALYSLASRVVTWGLVRRLDQSCRRKAKLRQSDGLVSLSLSLSYYTYYYRFFETIMTG